MNKQQQQDAETIAAFIKRNIPQNCFTCYHFQKVLHIHRKTGKQTVKGRYCRCPKPLKLDEYGRCAMWKLEPNPKYRQRSTVSGGRLATGS